MQALVPSAWVGFPDDYIAPMTVPFGTGSAGRAVQERRVVLVEDIERSSDYGPFREGARRHGVRAVLSVPMLTLAGEPMGALSAYYRGRVGPDERELELVGLYARQAAEMVERARLHAEARSLAALERRRGEQLRSLADAALALSAAPTLDDLLRLVTEAAREIIGCHQGVGSRLPNGWTDATTFVSLSERYAGWRTYDVLPKGYGVLNAVTRENRPLRLTSAQLAAHPEFRGLRDAPGHPPLPDYLGAPLVGRDGTNLGILQLSHRVDERPFSAEDEAVLVQLAQMTSSSIERLEAYERERAAREQAEGTARMMGLLSEASAVFAESFQPQGIMQALVDLLVPRLARTAMVHLVDEHGALSLGALQTGDPADRGALTAFFEQFPVDTSPGTPAGTVLRTGRPQALPGSDSAAMAEAARDAEQFEHLCAALGRSGLCLPLTARGHTVGLLALTRDTAYDGDDLGHVLDLARRAALALDNASRYAFERDLAVTLQRSLLPRDLPMGPGFRAAARYLAGARGTQVGGDWYDVVEVGDALVLVVGDVVGRGVQAAAVMGQLQATVRAYALDGHSPAAVLTRLDRVVHSVPDLHFTTCVVARLEPATGALLVCSAGHLPPVVADADGSARLLDVEPGRPLGVGGEQYVDTLLHLPEGAVLMLYTDGLVEERDASLTDGLDRLVRALTAPVRSADGACEQVLRALGRDVGTDDDTAVLAVHRCGAGMLEVRLPRTGPSARLARRGVRGVAAAHELDGSVAELLVSELLGNAVRHSGAGEADDDVVLRVTAAKDVLRVELDDCSAHLPEAPADRAAVRSRGGGSCSSASSRPGGGRRPSKAASGCGSRWPASRRQRARARARDEDQRTSSSTGTSGGSKPSTWP
jgi:GAF domain-containing protein